MWDEDGYYSASASEDGLAEEQPPLFEVERIINRRVLNGQVSKQQIYIFCINCKLTDSTPVSYLAI